MGIALHGVSAPKGSNPSTVGHNTIMKHAAAMKYGGELVAALDCNYDSFKELVPLCPECKEPVYLRAGGDRLSSKGKEYKIGAHWCHFKGVSAEQVAACENRVNGYTEKDKQRIAAKARGQRLKLLQRWFWMVADKNKYNLDVLEGGVDRDRAQHLIAWMDDGLHLSKHLRNLSEQNSPSIIYEQVIASEIGKHQSFYGVPTPSHLDQSIAREVLSFLATKLNRHSLAELYQCISNALCNFYRMNEIEDSKADCDNAALGAVDDALVLWVFSIPWAAEFQRLEAESQQRKGLAA